MPSPQQLDAFTHAFHQVAMVRPDLLLERIGWLDAAKHDLAHITQWAQRRAQEATA